MPKIGNSKSIAEESCPRCHSKRKIAKIWIEKIQNDHGAMVLKHTQIVCTNKECQAEFDRVLMEEADKRDKIRKIKEEKKAKPLDLKVIK